MLITDAMVEEGQCEDSETGDDLYFADFLDGVGEKKPLAYEVTIPEIDFYVPLSDDGVAHCYELDRATALDQFLAQCAGKYRFDVSAYKEVCVSGDWWAVVNSISFSDRTDADLFVIRFGK